MKHGNQGKRLAALAKNAKPTKIPLSAFFLVFFVFAIGSMLVSTYKAMIAAAGNVDGRPLKTAIDAPRPPRRSSTAGRISNRNSNGMKIPSPVFVTGLPKSGTTSTWKYFLCGLGSGKAAHQWAEVVQEDSDKESDNNGKTEKVRLGKCFQQNMKNNRPLLEGCGDYHVWTDMGVIAPGTCFYPSIHGGLEALYKDYPQATLLSVVRDTDSWVNSTTQFNSLWDRWIANKCDKFPGKGSTRYDYAKFYDWHTEMVRQFAKDHPSMTYIEVTLEGNDTGRILEEKTGVNASCWVHSKTKKGPRAKPKWLKEKERREKASGNKDMESRKTD